MNLIEKVFGTHSERELKLIRPIVDKILGMREQMVALSDDELRDNTRKFKERLANGETLDDLLPEAFATVREAARRVLNVEASRSASHAPWPQHMMNLSAFSNSFMYG